MENEKVSPKFDLFKNCHECYHFNHDLKLKGTINGYRAQWCDKHGAEVPKDFQEVGCDDFDYIPF